MGQTSVDYMGHGSNLLTHSQTSSALRMDFFLQLSIGLNTMINIVNAMHKGFDVRDYRWRLSRPTALWDF